MEQQDFDKLILTVLQGDDYDEVVDTLNQNGFFVTTLYSTGGFLKKRSVTAMIGVESSRLEEVLQILKTRAGSRMETVYQSLAVPHDGHPAPIPAIPMTKKVGGVTVFVMNLQRMEKY